MLARWLILFCFLSLSHAQNVTSSLNGVLVDPAGAPVPAIGLKELGIDAREFARVALLALGEEWASMEWACAKVRPVME